MLAGALASVAQGQQPMIQAAGPNIRLAAGRGGDVTFQSECQSGSYCDMVEAIASIATASTTDSGTTLADVVSTLDQHGTSIAEMQGGLAALDGVVDRVDTVTETVASNANTQSAQIAELTARVAELSTALADIYNCTAQGLLHHSTGCVPVVPHCTAPPAVANAVLVTTTGTNAYYPVGSTVQYRCQAGHLAANPESASGVSSTLAVTCGEALTWSEGASACLRPAGVSCKAIYQQNTSSRSGAYMIDPTGNRPLIVYCDMVTPTVDRTSSGWTLCGKYSAGHENGPRWLSQGFGRAPVNAGDMADLGTFSGQTLRWASIDCRPLISAGAQYWLHTSSVAPEVLATSWTAGGDAAWDLALYTNILADVRDDPTNLFDLTRDDEGQCRADVMTTWNAAGSVLDADDTGFAFQGRCLVGDGHHFCSHGRAGAAFSNARGDRDSSDPTFVDDSACYGSQSDSVYWAWQTDAHFCSPSVIGTGCLRRANRGNQGPGLPVNPFNYLMVW